jgi:hypothetical protein
MTAALLLWIDRTDIATAPNIDCAAVVVAGNDYGNILLWIDRARHCYCPNIPLTAAVVVAGMTRSHL